MNTCVVDRDLSSGRFYSPIDLNHPHVLAQNDPAPSESNPQFHQQMVYVACARSAISRRINVWRWSLRHGQVAGPDGTLQWREDSIYRGCASIPTRCARRMYYSLAKKAVLFGYFPAPSLTVCSGAPDGVHVPVRHHRARGTTRCSTAAPLLQRAHKP